MLPSENERLTQPGLIEMWCFAPQLRYQKRKAYAVVK